MQRELGRAHKMYRLNRHKGKYLIEDVHAAIADHTDVYGVPTAILLGREVPTFGEHATDERLSPGLVYLGIE